MRFSITNLLVMLSILGSSMIPVLIQAQDFSNEYDCETQEIELDQCLIRAEVDSDGQIACLTCVNITAEAAAAATEEGACNAADYAVCSALVTCICTGCPDEMRSYLECLLDGELDTSTCATTDCSSFTLPPTDVTPPPDVTLPPAIAPTLAPSGANTVASIAALWVTCWLGVVMIYA